MTIRRVLGEYDDDNYGDDGVDDDGDDSDAAGRAKAKAKGKAKPKATGGKRYSSSDYQPWQR